MSSFGTIISSIGAMEALSSLSTTSQSMSSTENELSTGLSINSPSDNPAGSIEATGFISQIGGLDQTISDTNQTVSMLQTAESGITQQTDIAQKLYGLAVEAANGTETSQERSSLQSVATQLLGEINSISANTQFNGQSLLDGSVSGMSVKTGSTSSDNKIINIPSTAASRLGSSSGFATNRIVHNWDASSPRAFGSGTLYVVGKNGVKSGPITVKETSAAGSLAKQINSYSSQTGVRATGTNTMTFTMTNPNPSAPNTYTAGIAVLDPETGSGINPAAFPYGSNGSMVSNAKTASSLASQINRTFAHSPHPLIATVDSKFKITITQPSGYNFFMNGTMGSGAMVSSSGKDVDINASINEISGRLKLTSSGSFSLINGSLVSSSVPVSSFGNPLSKINLSTASSAEKAMGVIKSALGQLGEIGGNLGAIQDGLESDTSNLSQAATNATTALGVVQDANIPQVTNNLTEEQISAQSGVAALKQSTQLQQSYISLLP